MSATIKYKGNTIASITTDSSKTLKTSGKYCEDDIIVENTKDGITPSGNKALTPSETAQIGIDVTNFATVSVDAIPSTYVGSGVTKKAAATVAPSTSEQTVCASGVYTTGEQKVSAITPSIVGNLDASSFAASIVSAIEGKGVTVPDGTLLDGIAGLIASIEAGGGYDVIAGTFTPGEDTDIYRITNSGGLTTTTGNNLVKYGILLSEQADTDISISNNYCSIVTFGDIQKSVFTYGYNSSYTKSEILTSYGIYISKGNLYVGQYYGSGKFRAGITYRYAVVL